MKKKTVFLPRIIQVVIKDEKGRDKIFYQLFINGTRGTIFGLAGVGLSLVDMEHLKELSNYSGCSEIEAVMADAVLAHLLRSLPDGVSFQKFETETMQDGLSVSRIIFKFREQAGH